MVGHSVQEFAQQTEELQVRDTLDEAWEPSGDIRTARMAWTASEAVECSRIGVMVLSAAAEQAVHLAAWEVGSRGIACTLVIAQFPLLEPVPAHSVVKLPEVPAGTGNHVALPANIDSAVQPPLAEVTVRH